MTILHYHLGIECSPLRFLLLHRLNLIFWSSMELEHNFPFRRQKKIRKVCLSQWQAATSFLATCTHWSMFCLLVLLCPRNHRRYPRCCRLWFVDIAATASRKHAKSFPSGRTPKYVYSTTSRTSELSEISSVVKTSATEDTPLLVKADAAYSLDFAGKKLAQQQIAL